MTSFFATAIIWIVGIGLIILVLVLGLGTLASILGGICAVVGFIALQLFHLLKFIFSGLVRLVKFIAGKFRNAQPIQ